MQKDDSNLNLLGADHTLGFVRQHLEPPARILDVGSGNGLLAMRLRQQGYDVTAIDQSSKAVDEAQSLGIETSCVSLFDYSSSQEFDAILMSRSFHHMNPILDAAAKSKALLKKGGIFILEDFAAELMDESTALWFFGVRAFLEACGNNQKSRGPKLENGQIPQAALANWRQHLHAHGVAESPEMIQALESNFRITERENVAYLYRYFLDDVNKTQGEAIFDWENRLTKYGAIRMLGLRIIAQKI
jgi:SAM-dependent methyltransferase